LPARLWPRLQEALLDGDGTGVPAAAARAVIHQLFPELLPRIAVREGK
jgi:hypothetical protein